jgi:hypothetical protein
VVATGSSIIGCRSGELVDRLVKGMPAAELDVEALCSILYAVLPYLTDWREELAAGLANGDGGRVIVPRFATVAVAEAIMAGLHGRQCEFVYQPEIGPCGVAMVHVPATHKTALFKSRDGSRMVEAVVTQIAQQLGVVCSGRLDLDLIRVDEALRVRAAGIYEEPLHYYFVYQDEAANREKVDAEWGLTLTALGDPQSVPRLALIRMQGKYDRAQIAVEELLAGVLRDPGREDTR